jgi:hypothetical protein
MEDLAFLLFFLSLLNGESAANDDIDKPTKTANNAIDFFIFPSVIFIFTRTMTNCVPNYAIISKECVISAEQANWAVAEQYLSIERVIAFSTFAVSKLPLNIK